MPFGNSLIVTYTSYLILKQASPEVKPHILYALARLGYRDPITSGAIEGIDYGPVGRMFKKLTDCLVGICEPNTSGAIEEIEYGPVGRIFDLSTDWLAICDNSEGRFDDPVQFWRWLLSPMGRTDEDILRGAWKGPGNMWVFVRPDRCVDWHSPSQMIFDCR